MMQIPTWSLYPWLRHGFSERHGGASTAYGATSEDGDLNLGFTSADDRALVLRNRATVVQALARDVPAQLITARQVHGIHIDLICAGDSRPLETPDGRTALEADGLMTDAPNLLLGIQAADCVPVLVADTRLRVVAAIHAGWRGSVAGIVAQGIASLRAEFGSTPEDLTAAIGPAIGVCCYAVGEEVETRFREAFPYASNLFEQHAEATHLNLAEANRRQLLSAGLTPERIFLAHQCTACAKFNGRPRFFSHRAEHGHTGRAMGLIGIAAGA